MVNAMKFEIYTNLNQEDKSICIGFKVLEMSKDEFLEAFGHNFSYREMNSFFDKKDNYLRYSNKINDMESDWITIDIHKVEE